MSIIFSHDDLQESEILRSIEKWEKENSKKIQTLVTPFKVFYMAENYHQKYSLKMHSAILEEFKKYYPDDNDLINSTSVARVNGFLAGWGAFPQLEEIGPLLGLTEESLEKVKKAVQIR